MNTSEKNKLKHDFLNSIVIINSLTKSASSFVNKISKSVVDKDIASKNQIELFLKSMTAIREQTSNIEKCFELLLDK